MNQVKVINLTNLPEATAQEVFDHIAKHLLTQKEKSKLGEKLGCAYRSPNGLKCAAGCLMSDEEYKTLNDKVPDGIENIGWHVLLEKNLVPHVHENLIVKLQQVHDNSRPEVWKHLLQTLSAFSHLDKSILDNF